MLGFIGVGKIGSPMARRLVAAGNGVVVHDVSSTALDPFRPLGNAKLAASPREVADQAEVVFLSLPSPSALIDVVEGAAGLLESVRRPIVVDLSTSGVPAARSAAAALGHQGFGYLDAPVSGGVPGAERGTLSIMAAGSPTTFETVRPYLEQLGKNIFFIGAEPGQGQAMKLVNNILSGTAIAATAEAMTVATKAGISPKIALDVLNVSTGRNSATEDKFPTDVITGLFQYGFTTGLIAKDVALFEQLADELSVPTIVCNAVVNAWRFALAQGLGPESFTAITKMYERWAGVEVREPGS